MLGQAHPWLQSSLQALQHAAECLGDKFTHYQWQRARGCARERAAAQQRLSPWRCGQLAEALASARSLEGLGLGESYAESTPLRTAQHGFIRSRATKCRCGSHGCEAAGSVGRGRRLCEFDGFGLTTYSFIWRQLCAAAWKRHSRLFRRIGSGACSRCGLGASFRGIYRAWVSAFCRHRTVSSPTGRWQPCRATPGRGIWKCGARACRRCINHKLM